MLLHMAAVFFGLLLSAASYAAPDEIVVFTDEFEKKGEVGYELHLNYAARARRLPDYAGEQAPYRVFRFMPEIVWGLSDTWNFGLHVPVSYDRKTHSTTVDGIKLRLHNLHVRETAKDAGYFYGVNYELSYYHQRIAESRYNGELRGILGTNQGDWKFTINPIISVALSHNPSGRRPEFEVFAQALRSFGGRFSLGIEHYASLGPLRNPTFGSQSEQISYLVAEFKTKGHFDVHLGVGHGWTAGTADKRVFKALIGLPF
jgi:hypothetical protein